MDRGASEDVPVLIVGGSLVGLSAALFLRQHSRRYRKKLAAFDSAALQALMEHSWPGNVRELDHAVERGVLMAGGEQVRVSDLALRATLGILDRTIRRGYPHASTPG